MPKELPSINKDFHFTSLISTQKHLYTQHSPTYLQMPYGEAAGVAVEAVSGIRHSVERNILKSIFK